MVLSVGKGRGFVSFELEGVVDSTLYGLNGARLNGRKL